MTGMNGGILFVPEALHPEFMRYYAQDVARGEPLYLCEQRTNFFNMFFDVDAKFDAGCRPTHKDFMFVFREIIREIRRYYPDTADERCFRCVVGFAPDKVQENGTKVGYHLHFPDLVVDKDQALMLHSGAASALVSNNADVFLDIIDWNEALDPCVYTSSGLRMLGSDKASPCPTCKDRAPKRQSCDNCEGKGRVCDNRPYDLLCVLNANNVDADGTRELRQNIEQMVLQMSIRSFRGQATPGFRRYEGAPSALPVRSSVNRHGAVTTTRSAEFDADVKGFDAIPHCKKRIDDSDLFTAIVEVVQNVTHDRRNRESFRYYRNVQIKNAHYSNPKKVEIWVTVSGEGSNYCCNKGGDHSSNTIYFSITPGGMAQRCFSHKQHQGVSCTTYCGHRAPIPEPYIAKLFPETVAQKEKRRFCELSTTTGGVDRDRGSRHDHKEAERAMLIGNLSESANMEPRKPKYKPAARAKQQMKKHYTPGH